MLDGNPEIVFFQLGGNDLDSDSTAESVTQYAMSVASDRVYNGVSLVILGEVLFQRKAHIPIQIYNAKVGDYNNCLLSQLIDTTYPRCSSQRFAKANIWQWDHLQMRRSVLPLL